jgi:hypothetical protein
MPNSTLPSFQFTRNFKANLADIYAFLDKANAVQTYGVLLDQLESTAIPNLARFPSIGHPFLQRRQRSLEVSLEVPTLKAKLSELGLDGELREYLMRDYLILYTSNASAGYLLSIRHHRQLSFDFSALWERSGYPPNEANHGKLLLQKNRGEYAKK